jgi:YtkA-like
LTIPCRPAALAAAMLCIPVAAHAAEVRAKADVECQPLPAKLQYDCTVKLADARTGEPVSDATVRVGADMPSMPMAHNVRPVPATAGPEAGTYRARLTLEMHGDWALQVNLSGPLRDRLVTTLRFDPDKVAPAAARAPPAHKH